MRTIILILVLIASEQIYCQANCDFKIDSSKILHNQNVQIFIDSLSGKNLVTKNNFSTIPEAVKKAINCWNKEFSIANPGQPYQATDAMHKGQRLPWRQLIYLGIGEHYLIMTYKHGGFVTLYQILLFKFNQDKVIDFWGGRGGNFKNKKEILTYLKSIKNKVNKGEIVL